jgi:hypothetical protein
MPSVQAAKLQAERFAAFASRPEEPSTGRQVYAIGEHWHSSIP